MIPMVDLTTLRPELRAEIDVGIKDVLDNGQFVLGPNVGAFEEEAAAYLGCSHAVSCASGTDALLLAMRAVGIGPGDEVITTAFSFFATAEAICLAGAVPVFVDIDARTFNLDPCLVEAAITPRTRAILPAHLFGQVADMSVLNEIAERHELLVIEDCAQAFGARHGKRKAGTLGQAGCFSFFPSKNLGAFGDGGLVGTSSEAIARELKVLRNHGSVQRYQHRVLGYNSRLDELQAVVLRAKLRYIEEDNAARRRVACGYDELLAGLDGVTTPYREMDGYHVYHQYTILAERRDRIMAALEGAGIACAVHYPVPIHRQEALRHRYPGLQLPVAERIAGQCLSLPIYPGLNDEQIQQVAAAVRGAISA